MSKDDESEGEAMGHEPAATHTPNSTPEPERVRSRRDAVRTRERILEVARERFAAEGYSATTLRSITDEAGVNVALVSRYFTSKEGLFEACLEAVVDEVRSPHVALSKHEDVAITIAAALAPSPGSQQNEVLGSLLPLLLHSSEDPHAEQMRVAVLRTFAENMATTAGWDPASPDDDLLMRAQIVLCAGMGLALIRSWHPLIEPLSSVSHEELVGAVTDMVEALLRKV